MRTIISLLVVLPALSCGPVSTPDAVEFTDGDGAGGDGALMADAGGDVIIGFEVESMVEIAFAPETEVHAADMAPELVGPQCAPGEGCFLDGCAQNGECQSGWCVEHLGEKVCTQTCQEECPAGWSCTQVDDGGPDLVFVCVSDYPNLCRPCTEADDCAGSAGTEDACVHYGYQGSFCGGKCAADGDCPWGFQCQSVSTVDGIELQQCVAETGACPCTDTSVELGLWTQCEQANDFGTCAGKRVCKQDGLTDCDAQTPMVETCNGLDDECDGETDEPALVDGDYVNLCDDGNDCTQDKCLGADGCANEILEVGDCSDGNPCTVADHCALGNCVGDPVECDDDNPCTDNVCTDTGGCEYPVNEEFCDDGDPCTVADHCDDGSCVGVSVPCDCQTDEDCAGELDDGNLCNGTLKCDLDNWPYHCVVDQGTVISCPEPQGVDAFCLASACETSSGDCSLVAAHEGLLCDNGDACSVNDKCQAGVCVAGPAVNCNDGNVCTDDSCNPESGCLHAHNQAPCTDGDVCTTQDQCQEGACVAGEPLVCDDGDVCTGLESCDGTAGCLPGQPLLCHDGDACTADTCDPVEGCQYGPPTDCGDGDACTADTCDPQTGQCLNQLECVCGPCLLCTCDPGTGEKLCSPACDDQNKCTVDQCDPETGECSHQAVECADDDICTDNACDPETGCVTTLNSAPCDDGSFCTLGDHCHLGECISTMSLVCDDKNLCTDDSCNPDAGCQFLPNQEACDDGNACTENDLCASGACKAGAAVVCVDGDVCTADTCDPATGCLYPWNDAPCDDGDVCSLTDTCVDGACVGIDEMACDDGNVCTDDSCDGESGCLFQPNQAGCEDGNACTENDVCADGWCTSGEPVVCNDGNGCTDDYCDLETGCQGTPNNSPCDDGNACTTNDACAQTVCVGGSAPNCDLGEPCKEYGCNEQTGCTSATLDNCCGNSQLEAGEECDDGNLVDSDGCESDCKLPTVPTVSLNGYVWYLAEKGVVCNVTCASVGKTCVNLYAVNYIESNCSPQNAVCPNFFPGLPCVTDGDGPRVVYSGNTPTQCKYRNWNYPGMTCTYSAGGNTAHMCACQ